MSDKDKDTKMSSIAKTLNKVEDRLEKGKNCSSVAEGLANVAKASELLSSVWTLPPGQLLRFHHDTRVAEIDGDSTPGFDGNKDDAERFIAISSSEIARYQRLMYANGVKGSRRRLLIILQGMDASGKGGIVRHVFSQGDPMGMHYHGFGAPKGEEKDHDYFGVSNANCRRMVGSPFSIDRNMKISSCRAFIKHIQKKYGRRDMTKSTDSNRNWLRTDVPSSKYFL